MDQPGRTRAIKLAAIAAILTVLQHIMTPARLTGSFDGIFDASLQSFYLGSDAGTAGMVRLFGVLLVFVGFRLGYRSFALGGGLIACMSFALTGHTVTHGVRWLLAPLLLAHVVIIAFWFGSLLSLRRIPGPRDAAIAITAFSRVASRYIPLIFVAGLALAWILLPSWAALVEPYGLMILAKIGGFAALIGMAAVNRWRLTPLIQAGDKSALLAFRRMAHREWVLIWIIIVVTASVTSFYSPGPWRLQA